MENIQILLGPLVLGLAFLALASLLDSAFGSKRLDDNYSILEILGFILILLQGLIWFVAVTKMIWSSI